MSSSLALEIVRSADTLYTLSIYHSVHNQLIRMLIEGLVVVFRGRRFLKILLKMIGSMNNLPLNLS